MGLSLVAMVVAAFGFLPVIAGALLQEAIDVAVILNALRALRGGVAPPDRGARLDGDQRRAERRHISGSRAASPTCARPRTGWTRCHPPRRVVELRARRLRS